MIVHPVAPEIHLCTFAPVRSDFATNIVILASDDQALLIDSGYERHAIRVVEYLGMHRSIDTVVLSHEHEDHSFGCRALSGCEVVTAPDFPGEIIENLKVRHVNEGDDLKFGPYLLEFRLTPGHSHFHLLIVIDNRIVHAGDLLVYTADGRPTPPYLADSDSLEDHVRSLELLRELEPEIVLTGHGPILKGNELILDEINLRLQYLARLQDADGALPLAACIRQDPASFSRHDFHEMNLKKLGLTVY